MDCPDCSYSTTKIANWQKHLATKKHADKTGFNCPCKKTYRSKDSLARHKKKCTYEEERRIAELEKMLREKDAELERRLCQKDSIIKEKIESILDLKDDIIEVQREALKQQDDIHEKLATLIQQPRVVNNTQNNTQNNFNLQIFLHETCRDAPTLDQFIQCIPIALSGDETIGDIFVKNLSKCALEKRPIHCTDVKRGKLAVKHTENAWEQDAGKIDPLLAQNVNKLRERYMRHLSTVWCLEHPRYMSNEKENDEWTQFLSMISEEVDAKFIAHISKATSIPK